MKIMTEQIQKELEAVSNNITKALREANGSISHAASQLIRLDSIELPEVKTTGVVVPVPKGEQWNTLFEYFGTDAINEDNWNDWVAKRRLSPTHARNRNLPGSFGRVFVHAKQDPPLMDKGWLVTKVGLTTTRERKGHQQFMVTSPHMEDGTYVHLRKRHKFEFVFRVGEKETKKESGYHNLLQLWGPTYSAFGRNGNPPFGFFTLKGQWTVQCYGAPHPMAWSKVVSDHKYGHSWGEVDQEEHHVELEWFGDLVDGYYSVKFDGEEIIKKEGIPTALYNIDPDGVPIGPTLHVGSYAVRQKEPNRAWMKDIKIRVEV